MQPPPDLDALMPGPPARPEQRAKAARGLGLYSLAGGLVGVVVGVAGSHWLKSSGLSPKWIWIVWLLAFAWMQVLIHEVGHALAGARAKMELLAVGVLGLRWQREAQGWRRQRAKSVPGALGYVMMLPRPDTSINRAALSAYLLGGPVANLLSAGLALLAASLLAEQPSAQLALYAFAAIGALLGLGNLLPFRSGEWCSDGLQLRELLRDPAGFALKQALYRTLSASRRGQRPRDWPLQTLPAWSSVCALESTAVLPMASLCLLRALDQNDLAVADACALRLAEATRLPAACNRTGYALLLATYAATRPLPLELLKAWRAEIGPHFLSLEGHCAWLDAEIAFAEGNPHAALSQLNTATAHAEAMCDLGSGLLLLDYVERLKARIATQQTQHSEPETASAR